MKSARLTTGFLARPLWVLLLSLASSACASPAYYLHLLNGQYELMAHRVPIQQLLADPVADPILRRRLERVAEARRFASAQLALPDNGSYRSYVALPRPYVAWNVFATPEFSLVPKEWCHLLVGCLAYRGYFDLNRAQTLAEDLRRAGYDVYVGPVPAYSTLGWFDDPVFSSMLGWDDDQLVATLFHELAHQRVFVSGDTAFNESFASFVGQAGLRAFRLARQEPAPGDARWQREQQFAELVLATRERLSTLYARKIPAAAMRAAKQEEIERLRREYAGRRQSWGGDAGYDEWFSAPINNAKLLPVGLYHQWVPAFARLFDQQQGDWPRFYAAVERLRRLPSADRQRELERLLAAAGDV